MNRLQTYTRKGFPGHEPPLLVNCIKVIAKYSTVYLRRVQDNLLHNTFTQCYVYYTVKLQVGTELCLKYWSLERLLIVLFLDISLHEVFLYDTPLKSDIRPSPLSIFSDPPLLWSCIKAASSSSPEGDRSSLEFSINNGKKKIKTKQQARMFKSWIALAIHRINRYPADK